MKPVTVVQIVGARPQFVKLAPVSRALAARSDCGIRELILHTGQHYDPQLSDVFFDELSIPPAAANLDVGSGPHGRQTALMLERIEDYLLRERPAAVVVYGDTNSTLAGALAASKLHVPLVHIEAGLRSFNRSMPEELNRIATDHLSDLLLTPTRAATENLAREGLSMRARQVGDVMYDALLENSASARRRSGILERLDLSTPFALATVHRAENTGPSAIARVMEILTDVGHRWLPIVFPVHPRTRDTIRTCLPRWRGDPAVRLIDPLGPMDMLRLTEAAAVVLTDSGGLQKEAFMLGVPCITLRSETEWIETVAAGGNVIVGHDLELASRAVEDALACNLQGRQALAAQARELYGGGHAAERCAAEIVELAGSLSESDVDAGRTS